MNVKSTFFHGGFTRRNLLEQPPGYVRNDSNLVSHLNKSLYGLKKSPWAWYAKMDSFLINTIFSICQYDPNVYTKKVGSHVIILIIYFDDLILVGSDPKLLNHVKYSLKKQFETTKLGYLHYFLGLQVFQTKEIISLSQSKYACDFICHFYMEYCKPAHSPFKFGVKLVSTCTTPEVKYVSLYYQLVGILFYLIHTHLNISFNVGLVSRYMKTPHESRWKK
jgi:hypothetical protein